MQLAHVKESPVTVQVAYCLANALLASHPASVCNKRASSQAILTTFTVSHSSKKGFMFSYQN